MIFILCWITTFKNARLIDPAIRPAIHVTLLEDTDHAVFDITVLGVALQCVIAVCGYLWLYAMTRRTKFSLLGLIPPFALNILHSGTHTLTPSLDVFVGHPLLFSS